MTKGIRPKLPFPELERRYKVYLSNNKSIRAGAQACGVDRNAFRASITQYEAAVPDIEFPEFPDGDLPTEKVLDQMEEQNKLLKKSFEAHTWFPIKVNDKKPIGIMWFGDPHLDDNGCDIGMLRHHAKLCNKPGVYGANIGDTTNNWQGNLLKKYADQNSGTKRARIAAGWFMLESKIKWLVWLIGNHDQWGDGAAVLGEMAKRYGTHKLILHDWEARFSLNFPNGVKINVWAAHDFPGDSMWNPLHGPVKAARFGRDTHLLVCGHKHNWGVSQWELAEKGISPVMIRTRGYKFNDDYARKIGKTDQKSGSSIFTIINPLAPTDEGRIIPFVDVETGVDYLQFLRTRV